MPDTHAALPSRRPATLLDWVAWTLALTGTLTALRVVARFVLDAGHIDGAGWVTWHTSNAEMPRLLLISSLAGSLLATAILALAYKRLGTGLLATAVGLPIALGVTLGLGRGVEELATRQERMGLLWVGGGVLVVGGVLACAVVLRHSTRRARFLPRGLAPLLGLAMMLAPPTVVKWQIGVGLRSFETREVVRDLISEEGGWSVLRENPLHPAEVAVITPSMDYRIDGGDRPGLLMPPPCRIEFTVRPEDGPVTLCLGLGMDGVERPDETGEPDEHRYRVRCKLQVNGELIDTQVLERYPDQPVEELAWRTIGRERGLQLEPGDRVTLSTALIEVPEGLRLGQVPRLPVGFSDLVFERRVKREQRPASKEHPNIVLIVMDTLRADHLSCYGHPDASTPALDALAKRGVLFESAYATSSWTWPSTASILTGLWPERHGVTDDGSCFLDHGLETLPEVLARSDYATGAFTCNPLIVASKNFDQGSALFDGRPQFRKTDRMLPKISRWLDSMGPQRFFLYLHLVDPHSPVVPTPEASARAGGQSPEDYPGPNGIAVYHNRLIANEATDEAGVVHPERLIPPEHQEWMKRSYLAGVMTADQYIGEILELLEARGLEGRTVVAFTSDHGEELLQHGLATHGQSLNEELVRVPMILAGPGLPAGLRVPTPVSNRHLAPTLAARGGARFSQIDDPLDLLALEQLAARPIFFSTHHGWWGGHSRTTIYGIRNRNWVLHYAPEARPRGVAPEELEAARLRLFDLAADPGQRVDLSAREPELVERLRKALLDHVFRAESQRPRARIAAGSETMQMLRDIGYVGD